MSLLQNTGSTLINFRSDQLPPKRSINQSFIKSLQSSKSESDDYSSPAKKRNTCDRERNNTLKVLLEKVRDKLKEIQSKKYVYYGPYLFTCIYEIGVQYIEDFNKLVNEDPELGKINKEIVDLFKEVSKWVGEFIKKIPFCYFGGKYKADIVFKTISGVKFTFDFWGESFGENTEEKWRGEHIEWWNIYKDSWLEPNCNIKLEPNLVGHWWWCIHKELF